MARKPRIHYPGALYHVILRGNNAQDVFLQAADRQHFYTLIHEGVERFGYRVHAFCLMSNHVHIALQVGSIPLSKLLHNLSFRYTQWFNKRYERIGHLFHGRYKAILVGNDSYLFELIRYIHLNPVRAELVSKPQDYLWSGHRTYLGLENLKWLTTSWLLSQLSPDATKARQQYQKLIMDGINKEDLTFGLISNEKNPRIIEKDIFIESSTREETDKNRYKQKFTTQDVIAMVCKYYQTNERNLSRKASSQYLSTVRAVVAWICLEYSIDKLTNLGKIFNRDPASLSYGVKQVNLHFKKDLSILAKQLEGQA